MFSLSKWIPVVISVSEGILLGVTLLCRLFWMVEDEMPVLTL